MQNEFTRVTDTEFYMNHPKFKIVIKKKIFKILK